MPPFNPSLSTVLVIILCYSLGRRAGKGSRHQILPSVGGDDEAETSMKMPPMHSGDGEGYIVQNPATGVGEESSL